MGDGPLRRRACRGEQGSADAALVDLGRRGRRVERDQTGARQAGLHLERRARRRRRRRRGHDHFEGHGRRRPISRPPPISRLLRARLCRCGQARRHHPPGDQGGWAKVIPTALQKFTTVDGKWAASGQHPFCELDLGQQGRDGKDRRDGAQDFRRVDCAARQGQEGRRHSVGARRPALAGSDDVRLGRRLDRRHRPL